MPTNLEFQLRRHGQHPDRRRHRYGGARSTRRTPSAASQAAADLYGSIVVKQMTATGGASIHYDRRLAKSALTAGNYMMSAFTWKNY